MATYTKRYEITQDTYIDGYLIGGSYGATNNNYSTSTTLRVGEVGSTYQSILIGVDASNLKYKKIIAAELYLYNISGAGTDTTETMYFYWFREPWKASEITGANIGSKTTAVPSKTVTPMHSGSLYKYDIVKVLQEMQSQDKKNNTNILKNGVGFERYYSSENISVFSSTKGTNKPYLEITYEDVPPLQPNAISPSGSFINNIEVIQFTWQYNTSVSDVQSGFELQWKHESGDWKTISQTTKNQYYDMPKNTFPSGNISWRVRTKNQYGEYSPYSSILSFTAIGAPSTPVIISVEQDKLSPIVTWSATSQQVYQLQILRDTEIVYDTGNVASVSERTHKVNMPLNEGQYTARIRIKNEYDLLSEWGELGFTIKSIKPPKPILSVSDIPYGILLEINAMEIDDALVYRRKLGENKFICIGKLEGFKYKDYSISKKYEYFVRVFKEEAYEDSDIKIAECNLKYSTLAPVSNLEDLLVLKSNLNSVPPKDISLNIQSTKQHYTGRELPVVDYTIFKDNTYTFTFYLKEEEVEKFIDIYHLRQIILYRDKWFKIYGQIDGINIQNTDLNGYTIRFSITETDYVEEVEV